MLSCRHYYKLNIQILSFFILSFWLVRRETNETSGVIAPVLPKATICIGSGARFAPRPCPLPNPLHCASDLVSLGMQTGREKPDSYVPAWDGSSRTWRRYCKEVSWFLSGTKANQRQYAAAKLITRLTGPARLLSMSWRQRDFEGEQGVAKMLQCFAASPETLTTKCCFDHV